MQLNFVKCIKQVCSEENGWEILQIPFECDLNNLQAKGIFSVQTQINGIGKLIPKPFLTDLNRKTCLIHFVKPLNDDYTKNLRFSGGKANSLALLSSLEEEQNQFKIPSGIVVYVAAFTYQIRKNLELLEILKQLESRGDEDLEEFCERYNIYHTIDARMQIQEFFFTEPSI